MATKTKETSKQQLRVKELKKTKKTQELIEKISKYKELRKKVNDLNAEMQRIKEELVNTAKDLQVDTLVTEAGSVIRSSYFKTIFDSARFQKDRPRIYEKYLTEQEINRNEIR